MKPTIKPLPPANAPIVPDPSLGVEIRLREMAEKWRDANRAVHDVCRDAAEEIRVLRLRCAYEASTNKSIIHSYNHGSGWGKGKDE